MKIKNPFIKDDNTGTWITALVVGAIAAGAATYYYITYSKNKATAEAEAKEKATAYMKDRAPKKKKERTDLHDLEDIVMHQ